MSINYHHNYVRHSLDWSNSELESAIWFWTYLTIHPRKVGWYRLVSPNVKPLCIFPSLLTSLPCLHWPDGLGLYVFFASFILGYSLSLTSMQYFTVCRAKLIFNVSCSQVQLCSPGSLLSKYMSYNYKVILAQSSIHIKKNKTKNKRCR